MTKSLSNIGGYRRFAFAGLIVAAFAIGVAAWIGGDVSNQRTGLIAAGALAVGDVAAALWAAGAERSRQRLGFARVGLIAAMLSFVGLWLIVAPLSFFALSGGAKAGIALAIAALAGAVVVWTTHRLAWRRFAPKAGAP